MKKICFTQLGCFRNTVDGEIMLFQLLKEGFIICSKIEQADILIINTCGFIKEAKDESIAAIAENFNKKKKHARVIICGCMVSICLEELKKLFPDAHFYLGPGDIKGIVKACNAEKRGQIISEDKSFLGEIKDQRFLITPSHFAYLKIAEGCRKKCSYCIIPKIKGPLKSKTVHNIVEEFKSLIQKGVFEIILVAQDLGDYGCDLKQKTNLFSLIKELLKIKEHNVDFVSPSLSSYWLRLLYLYPDEISDELIDLLSKDKRICPYLDMPIQHINDRILKSMGRATTKADIIRTITTLRKKIPNITLRTSFIVGFPSETNEEFEELLQFAHDYAIDYAGIFKFSKEKGTRAYDFKDQISEEVKEDRYQRLANIQKKIMLKKHKKLIGSVHTAIIDGYHPESNQLFVARTQWLTPDIDPVIIINDLNGKNIKQGQKCLVKITDIADYDLIGKIQ
jgi:ribosomal protein S12 methylthiotransferase